MLPATVDFPVSPVVIAVGIGLLIYTLGYSALVGAGVSGTCVQPTRNVNIVDKIQLLIIIAPTQGTLSSDISRTLSVLTIDRLPF